MKTTLNAIRACDPCREGWKTLLRHLGKTKADDEPLSIITVLDSNGIEDALWSLRAVSGHDREMRLYAVWCARQIQHLTEDERSIAAIDVAERHANGAATDQELAAARPAACEAACAAARRAAWAAACTAACTAAWSAAWAAACDAAQAGLSQEQELRRVCACIERGEDPYPNGTTNQSTGASA